MKSLEIKFFFRDNAMNSEMVKLATLVEGDPKTPFSIATTP